MILLFHLLIPYPSEQQQQTVYQYSMRNIRLNVNKIKNKQYKQGATVSIAQIKNQSKSSFEALLEDNTDFATYITKTYERMIEEQQQNPILVIPKKFINFINSKLFKELIKRLYEYLTMINQYQQKFVKIADPFCKVQLMTRQSHELKAKCAQISYIYMGILLSYGESKNIYKDQYFFETMMYFISEIFKENFEEEVYPLIDQQFNRIFRTNTFNLIKRRYQEDDLVKKYPELKDSDYQSNSRGHNALIKRLTTHRKFRYQPQIQLPQPRQALTKPINIRQSASKAINSRSPLIASFFPSSQEKLFNYSQQRKERDSLIVPMRKEHSFSFTRR